MASGRVLRLLALIGCVAACKKSDSHAPATCLPLPPAERSSLVADPSGTALYWIEGTPSYSYGSERRTYWKLIRYDLRTKQTTVVFEPAKAPVAFIAGNVLTGVTGGKDWVAMIAPNGTVQDLAPDNFHIADFEVIDDRTLALLVDEYGERAVYTVDLATPRPRRLVEADVLLSATASSVYVWRDDDLLRVDAKTGATTPMTAADDLVPYGDRAAFVDGETLVVHNFATGDIRPAVPERREWRLVHQLGSVLARTPVHEDRSHAVLLTSSATRVLPIVRGGASIIGAAEVGNRTWAIIGHNTSNYIGDLYDTPAETDVCVLPAASEVTFPTRSVPARFVEYAERIFDLQKATAPDATLQIFDGERDPVTVSINLEKEDGADDFERMRARAREIGETVTKVLRDREIRTEVIFADGRRAYYRWRRDRLRWRASAGFGDALLSDPATFDIEVLKADFSTEKDVKTCSGSVRNPGTAVMEDIRVRCWSTPAVEHVIAKLEPGGTEAFALNLGDEEAEADLHLMRGEEPIEFRWIEAEETARRVFELAAKIHADTGFALVEHTMGADISVVVNVDVEFVRKTPDERRQVATRAHQALGALREIYKRDATAEGELTLDIHTRASHHNYRFDGTTLSDL